jgi:hypothetical protein
MTPQDASRVSVLFERPQPRKVDTGTGQAPSFFRDLHLDQVVDSVLAGREEYELAAFFYSPLQSVAAVRYRQEVMKDLEKPELASSVRSFAEGMARTRSYLRGMGQVEDRYYKQGWFLDAAENYCSAVTRLLDDLGQLPVGARALKLLREYLGNYADTAEFVSLTAQVRRLRADLADVQYCLLIKGGKVIVNSYDGEPDYSAEIKEIFAKFRQGAVKDFRKEFRDQRDANHVQAQVLERVAGLYPEIFARMEACYVRYGEFVDSTVASFYREVQFYLAYMEFAQRLKDRGLPFCYPEVSETSKQVQVEQAFDIALANVLVARGSPVVSNDVELREGERILVVTGPNQGGKTTFARMFGQLHYLAALGLPVPGTGAQLFLPDHIFSHFEREERLDNLSGKLDDELVRARDILAHATSRSIIIMNEGFSSTTLADSLFIGTRVLEQVSELGALCVYVTFVDELATLNEATVSVVANVVPADPEVRTLKLTRRPADGRAYALALAGKYGLTYASLRQRVAP